MTVSYLQLHLHQFHLHQWRKLIVSYLLKKVIYKQMIAAILKKKK